MEKLRSLDYWMFSILILGFLFNLMFVSGTASELDYLHNMTVDSYKSLYEDQKVEVFVENKSVNFSCPDPNISFSWNYSCPVLVCPEYSNDVFDSVLRSNVDEHQYSEDYDCTEFSKELERRLEEIGWRANWIQTKVDCESGILDFDSCNKYGGRHDIVVVYEVYVEATSGKVISPQDYESYGLI